MLKNKTNETEQTLELLNRLFEVRKEEKTKLSICAINNLYEQEMGKKRKRKDRKASSTYVPRQSSIDALRVSSYAIKSALESFSPFLEKKPISGHSFIDTPISPERAIKPLIPFKVDKISLMSIDTKNEILEAILEGIVVTLREHRDEILGEEYILEDNYERNRLKIAMKLEKKPTILTMKDFEKIEAIFVAVLKKAIRIELGMGNYDEYSPVIQNIDDQTYSFKYEILIESLKQFDIPEAYAQELYIMYKYYLENGNKLTPREIADYKEFKQDLFLRIINMVNYFSAEHLYTNSYNVIYMNKALGMMESLSVMVKRTTFIQIAEHIVEFYELSFKELNSRDLSQEKIESKPLIRLQEFSSKMNDFYVLLEKMAKE